jgi:signal transduction histidine kinase
VRAVRDDGSCEVSVHDTGPGIPKEHLPLVFERFYRVDPSRSRDDGGTGIGLAIARSVVEAHGGRIWAESEAAGGSTFRFVLPIQRGPVERTAKEEE